MRLSVVVPSYNVSNYLEECIESIVKQEIDNMEILIVNDGSTDNTLEIAKRLELKYNQIKVIDQPNGGLGNARNTGIEYASGQYLTFVDSDDIICEDAYKKMLSIIDESGSDFIIGNVVRFNSTRIYPSVLHQKVFIDDLVGINIHTRPELMYDTTAWNKIFRMEFWKKFNFRFPEKMLYEDIPVTLPAHSVAEKVDVLTDIVYKWRARDAGDNSITQQKEKIENFVDRVKGIDMVKKFFSIHDVSDELKNAFDYKNLSMDFPLYLTHMLEVDINYQSAVKKYIKNYMYTVSHKVFMELSLLSRIQYRLIEEDRFDDFLELLKFEKKKKTIMKPCKTKKGLTFNYPFLEVLSEEEQISIIDFVPNNWIEKVSWDTDRIRVFGVAYLDKLDTSLRNKTKCKVILVNERTQEKIIVSKNLKMKFRPEVTLNRGIDFGSKIPFKRMFNYNYSGYEITISKKFLEKLSINDRYFIEMELSNSGITKNFRIKSPQKGFMTKPCQQSLSNSIVVSNYNGTWEIYIQRLSVDNSFQNVEFIDENIVLTGMTYSNFNTIDMYSERSELYFELPVTKSKNKFSVIIPKTIYQEILSDESREQFDEILKFSFKDTGPLTYNSEKKLSIIGLVETGQLTIMSSQDAIFRLRLGETLPIVTKLIDKTNYFEFEVSVPNTFFDTAISYKFIMKGIDERVILKYSKISQNKNETYFSVQVPYTDKLREKVYAFYLSKEIQEQTYTKYIMIDENQNDFLDTIKESEAINNTRISEKYLTNEYLTPICLFNIGIDKVLKKDKGIKYEIYHPFGKNHLQYRISSYWEKIDDGPRRQEVVRRVLYPLWRKLPMKENYCVIESFWGREFSDNPKAVYDYLSKEKPKMKFILSIQDTLDNSIEYNRTNTKIVKLNSWRYIYYLARSKFFVNNVNFPDYYIKRERAVEIQTMHGTPLKKLGLDNPGEIPDYQIDNFIKKCKRWDYLTIPSNYVGDIAKSAYQFEKEFLKIGYPRNDSLFIYNERIKKELLEKYNLPDEKKIILYAPTWRVKGKFSMPLDLQKMKDNLSDEYILVIKLHHYMLPNFNLDGLEDFAFVFGKESQISDFYKLADILVTDYSSVMFDYAILNKPMIFFTYDYENYKNNLREMYFDFKKDAPGPMVYTTESVISEVSHIDKHNEKYADRIEKFRNKFIQYDHGDACKKLVEYVIK